ncbi:hypothetical protein [Burkholderia cenocepacia]|uniref:hypothetical protein n=1 Tax=Burkholderia cenocepacia TaxID=95486 RepID=UPI0007611F62|nr:hypothetical protein [Burkholderia cenocepacia]KWU17935.1 hypothetical protein AS149_14775 [Burkholderia cenocepacia]
MKTRHIREAQRRAFEQLATRRGYELERNGDLYLNQVTNEAWSFYWAGFSQMSPVEEAGPWLGGVSDTGSASITSNDFAHDVAMHVSGDFSSRAEKLAYVEELARRLNRSSAQACQPDGTVPYERVEPFYRGFYQLLAMLGVIGAELPTLELTELLERARNRLATLKS